MSNRAITPHCAWAIGAVRARQLPPMLRWLIVTIAERVDRHTLQWWSSIAAMMCDTGLSRRQVQYLIRDLPPDLIAVRRGANGRWMFTLLRPLVDPEAHAPERGAQYAPPDPERGAQHAPYPLKQDYTPEGKEERGPPAAPTAPADPPPPVQSSSPKEASRIVTAAPSRRIPLPDGWQPDPEVRAAALAEGIDPDAIREELHDWWLRNPDRPQGDWNATFRGFVRQAKRGQAKRNRVSENAAWVAESVAIVRAAQRGEAAL